VAEKSDKPVFNERALAKLLEAAYVVQEHNRGQQAEAAPGAEADRLAAEAKTNTNAKIETEAGPAQPLPSPAAELAKALEAEPVPAAPPAISFTPISRTPVAATPVSATPVSSPPVSDTPLSSAPLASAPIAATPPTSAPTSASPISVPSISAPSISASAISTAPISAPPIPAAPVAKDDYATTLAQIVETQGQIRERLLDLKDPMAFIAERVAQISRAGGAAIGIVEGENLRYRASAGRMTPSAAEVAKERALCALCLQSGQVVRCSDVDSSTADSAAGIDAAGIDPAGINKEEYRRRGIQAMIAVPIFHDGAVAGGLELYYDAAHAFLKQDVHTAQLMAGLVTEVLAREEEVSRRKSLAGERALMLQALERLQPNLAALVDTSAGKAALGKAAPAKDSTAQTSIAQASTTKASTIKVTATAATPASAAPGSAIACRKCGHDLMDEEQFCGKCGSPRSGDYEAPSTQSKVASMWHMQEALKKIPGVSGNGGMGNGVAGNGAMGNTAGNNGAGPLAEPAPGFDDAEFQKMLTDSLEKEMPELFQPLETRAGKMWPETLEPPADASLASPDHELVAAGATHGDAGDAHADDAHDHDARDDNPNDDAHDRDQDKPGQNQHALIPATVLAKPARSLDWSSAASAREFLEQLAGNRSNGLARFWRARRGDFYLALAVILVAIVVRWGIWSNHAVSATGTPASAAAQHRKSPDADLSWFDRTLVKLGLAEAPAPAEYKGNPETEVWIDLRTALYYCPGTDLYGKTPKGKFETQRDAQLDQFEPAYRKACD